MIFCKECFNDFEIRAQIENLGRRGDCPICGKKSTWIYDSELDLEDSEVEDYLISVLKIYHPESGLLDKFPEEGKDSIERHLLLDWNIFNVEESGIRQIVQGLIENALDVDEKILAEKVGIPELYNDEYLEEHSIMGKYSWSDFRKCLRNENRFHSRYIQLEVLGEILKETEITIKKGTKFYRARKSNEQGFAKEEMGAPPSDKASPGRVNSKGISCLYLANKRETTVKEIRANAFDYVTIAAFSLIRDVRILDLSTITHNSPFSSHTDKVNYLINEKHLKNIERDLAKPLTNQDSDLDYLPTQYISDFAKFIGYDGVKYISTFDKNSYNIALFDVEAAECTYCRNYQIGDLKYKMSAL